MTKNLDDMAKPTSLLQRLAYVQNKVGYIQKEKKAGMRYSIVSHDAVTAKVRPHMVDAGVLYYPHELKMEQVGNRTQITMYVTFVSTDDPHDSITVATAGFGIDDQDKGPGKAISYAVKYAILKMLGLESGDDPDLDQDSQHDDPANAHHVALRKFEAEVTLAENLEQLRDVGSKHKLNLDLARVNVPGRYQVARQAYVVKQDQFKKQEA